MWEEDDEKCLLVQCKRYKTYTKHLLNGDDGPGVQMHTCKVEHIGEGERKYLSAVDF